MNKKILYILLYLFIFSFSHIYGNDEILRVNDTYGCDFFSQDCVRFSEPFNTFEIRIDEDSSDFLEDIDYDIYNKYNTDNKVKAKIVKKNDRVYEVTNLNPFIESSVYVLDLTLNQKNRNVNSNNSQKFEFIFDNNENIISPIIHTNDFFIENKNFIVSNFNYNLFYTIDNVAKKGISSDNISFEKEFNLNDIGDGINIINFYNGLGNTYSNPIQRIVFFNYDENLTSSGTDDITLEDLEDNYLNYDTNRNSNGDYTTKKKEFIVYGQTKKNSPIYVNGIKTISDNLGNFASFVFLNEGLNEIDIVTNFSKKSINVTYLSSNNKILSLDYDKIVKNTFSLQAEFLESSNYHIYINGENKRSAFSNKINNFNIPQNDLQNGVNYLTIILENSQVFEDIFLVDKEKPTIEVFDEDKFTNGERFYFKLSDDISIKKENIVFKIDNINKKIENLFGDIYYTEIENLNEGSRQYVIQIEDLVDKTSSKNGNIFIDNDFLKIKKIEIDSDGIQANKDLFLKNGERELKIIFSNDVLIDKIFIDNFHITDYEILDKNQIKLEKNFENENGVIVFEYCEYDGNPCNSETFNYYKINEPEVKLDYVNKNFFLEEDSVKIYGEVESDYLIRDNSNKDLTLYSNIFEMIVYSDEKQEIKFCNILNKCTNTILNSQEKIDLSNSKYDNLQNYLSISEQSDKNFIFGNNYISQNFLTYSEENNLMFSKKQENGFQVNEVEYYLGNRYFQSLLDASNIETFEMGTIDNSNYEKNIYFKNLKENYYENEIEIVGNYIGDIESIRVDLKNCEKEDKYKTFKCNVFLDEGENIIEVEFDGNTKNITTYNKYNSNSIIIEDVSLTSTDDNPMLLFGKSITISVQNFESGILSYMGQEKIITLDDSNQITIDLSDQILEDNLNFEVFIKEDRGGNIYTSNKLKYEYVGSNALSRIIIN